MTFSRKTLFSVMQVKTRSLHGFHLDPAITFLNHIILIQQENICNPKNRCERLFLVDGKNKNHSRAPPSPSGCPAELLMAAEDLLPRSMAVGPNRRLHFSAVNTGIGT